MIPTYIKDLTGNRALLNVWLEARERLLAAQELIVIGYSLPPADAPARLLLASALAGNANISEFSVVAGARPHGLNWESLAGVTDKQLRPIWLRFEDWVIEESAT